MSHLDKMSQETYQTKSSQTNEQTGQSRQQISELDLHSLSPDDNSLDNPVDICVSHNISTVRVPRSVSKSAKRRSVSEKPKIARKAISSEKLDKRERNRIAAQKLREKRKQEKLEIRNQITYWENRIAVISEELKKLEDEKEKYMSLLKDINLDKNAKLELMDQVLSIKEEYWLG